MAEVAVKYIDRGLVAAFIALALIAAAVRFGPAVLDYVRECAPWSDV